jgi:hypothetical protein
VRQVNPQSAGILSTTITLPRFSSYYLDVGGFFGAGGVMREKLYLSRAISLIYLLVYFGALKI